MEQKLKALLLLAEDDIYSAKLFAVNNNLLPDFLANLTPSQLAQIHPDLR